MHWNFILHVLKTFSSPTNLVNGYTKSPSQHIINVTPKGFFNCGRVVRQGDPLSPIILCLAEDFLSCLIQRRMEEGSLLPIAASRGGSIHTHLLFVDIFHCFAEPLIRT